MISVVIPTCNRLQLLSKCLDCLSSGIQTLPADQYEVIVTDDSSAESTAESLILEKYPWVRWVAGPRRGLAANRNNGIKFANGEFIAFTDDDCIPSPDWLSAYAAAIRSDLDVYEGRTTCAAGLRSPLDHAPVNLHGGCLWGCNMMIRAQSLREVCGFDEDFPFEYEDVEFFGRAKRSGLRWQFVPAAVVDHPVRRQKIGWRAGAKWKPRVLLWYKEGNRVSTWRWLPVHLLKVRVRQVLDFSFSRDFVLALASIPFELAAVLCHLSSWERQYRSIRGGLSAQQRSGRLSDITLRR